MSEPLRNRVSISFTYPVNPDDYGEGFTHDDCADMDYQSFEHGDASLEDMLSWCDRADFEVMIVTEEEDV